MEIEKMNPLKVVETITSLTPTDRDLVEKGYYITFPEAAKSRFANCCLRISGRRPFSAFELNRLSKFFVWNGEKWVLDPSDKFMAFLGLTPELETL